MQISQLQPGDIWTALLVLVALCAAITAVGGCVKLVAGWFRESPKAKKIDNHEKRLRALEDNDAKQDREIKALKESSEDLKKLSKLTLRGVNALIGQQLNSVDKNALQDVQEDIMTTLTDHI